MDVLVGFASDHGSTKGVAERIASRLRNEGFEVDLRPIDGIDALDCYHAVVLGSAIHNQAWLPRAAKFIDDNAAGLASRPTWLFSVSSVGDTNSFFGPRVTRWIQRSRQEPKGVTRLLALVGARAHRNFTGAVERGHWNVLGTVFLRTLGGTFGDHRDWADIDAWASALGQQLRTLEPSSPDMTPEQARTVS
jgi:menaquinone-dependent protoporphyrinogen oxidase